LYAFLINPHARYMPRPYSSPWFHHTNIWWRVQTMELLIVPDRWLKPIPRHRVLLEKVIVHSATFLQYKISYFYIHVTHKFLWKENGVDMYFNGGEGVKEWIKWPAYFWMV
jgi:hypothetical protein